MSDWPKHPDGTNKFVGEMTPEERHRVCKEASERSRRGVHMADHKWEAGAYGTCKRCGTNPDIAFPRDQHPK